MNSEEYPTPEKDVLQKFENKMCCNVVEVVFAECLKLLNYVNINNIACLLIETNNGYRWYIWFSVQVLAAGDHVINNKKIDPKKAKARHGKIFVGGLSTELSDEDIKSYFAQYGSVSTYICLYSD